ncbi:MAG: hypothetical protein ACO29U_00165 [Crocinitomicaceae bacterium]
MNWTKEYIEARMLDAIEGNLSSEDLQKLRDYLIAFPEFGSLEEDFSSLTVHSSEDTFPKELLLKEFPFSPKAYDTVEGEAIEKMVIAKIEGLLDDQEEEDFDQTLKIELVLQKEWELMNQTILIPDEKVGFPNSDVLFKEPRIIPWRNYLTYAAAASILFFLYIAWPNQDPIAQAKRKTKIEIAPTQVKNIANQRVETPVWSGNTSPNQPMINKQVEPIKNEVPNCIIPDTYTETTNDFALNLTVEPQASPVFEGSSIIPISKQSASVTSTSNEVMGFKEFVIQKGNQKIFGLSNPTTSEKYTSITNYLAKTTNVPITYRQELSDDSETTFFKLGFITIERKRSKK